MFFKNLTVFTLPKDWALPPHLAVNLPTVRALGEFDRSAYGFISPADGYGVTADVHGRTLIALAVDEKILPAAVVKRETEARARKLAVAQDSPVGRRQLRELRESVTQALLKVALVRRRVTRALIDPEAGYLIVDTGSQTRADEVVGALREALGTFAVEVFLRDKRPAISMAAWLRSEAPAQFETDDSVELQAIDKSRATIKYARTSPDAAAVATHLGNGLQVAKLGLTWRERVAFILTAEAQLKRVEFLNLKSDPSVTDPQERFENEVTLMALTFANLITDLDQAVPV